MCFVDVSAGGIARERMKEIGCGGVCATGDVRVMDGQACARDFAVSALPMHDLMHVKRIESDCSSDGGGGDGVVSGDDACAMKIGVERWS